MEKYIQYNNIKMGVKTRGAELFSVQIDNVEYMWNKNEIWAKSSPILFPFIGKLKNDKYTYKDKEYSINTRHGFARDMDFNLIFENENTLVYEINSTSETKKIYPFDFTFQIRYEILENSILMEMNVINKTKGEMLFSLGAHPAFYLEGNMEDYIIKIDNKQKLERYTLEGPYLSNKTKEYGQTDTIEINDEIFKDDAIIFDGNITNKSSIISKKTNRKITVIHEGYEFIAYWKALGANFVCIEPWFGITDCIDTDGKLENKKGIIKLKENEEFKQKLIFEFEGR